MTIVIGMTLPDGVLLVADGRQTFPLIDKKIEYNDIDKIKPVGTRLYTMSAGIVQGTDFSSKHLQENIVSNITISEFASLLSESVRKGWLYLQTNLDPNIDINNPIFKVGLIAGGIINYQPFVTGCLYGSNMEPSEITRTDLNYKYILLGGEDQDSIAIFEEMAKNIIRVSWQKDVGPLNKRISILLGAAKKTIHKVSSLNNQIGGNIRYVLIRSGYPVVKDILV